MTECYSCGAAADPDSPRNFCRECDAHFAAGGDNQERVYARAWLLEEAKFNEDRDRVEELMGEIFRESVIPPVLTAAPVSTATAKKASK